MKSESARRLAQALSDAGMRAQDLVERSGVSKASISQYLSGTHTPSNISAGKMGAALGVNPLWLMGFDVEKKRKDEGLTEGEREILEFYRNLNDMGKEMVLEFIRMVNEQDKYKKSDRLNMVEDA